MSGGETVEITDRGRPIARLVPVHGGLSLLDRLVAEGRAVAPTNGRPMPVPPVLGDPDVSAADELVAARESEPPSLAAGVRVGLPTASPGA